MGISAVHPIENKIVGIHETRGSGRNIHKELNTESIYNGGLQRRRSVRRGWLPAVTEDAEINGGLQRRRSVHTGRLPTVTEEEEICKSSKPTMKQKQDKSKHTQAQLNRRRTQNSSNGGRNGSVHTSLPQAIRSSRRKTSCGQCFLVRLRKMRDCYIGCCFHIAGVGGLSGLAPPPLYFFPPPTHQEDTDLDI